MKVIVCIATAWCLSLSVSVSGQQEGMPAPDFEVNLEGGGTFRLSDHEGKVVLIFFFGNTCPYCLASGPSIESDLHQPFLNNANFVAVGLDTWDGSSNEGSVAGFRASTGITFPLAIKAGNVASQYQTTYDRLAVIDHKGVLLHKGVVATSGDISNTLGIINFALNAQANDPCNDAGIVIQGSITHPSCSDGTNGSIDLSVQGNHPGFHFLWSNEAETEDLEDLSGGTYSVLVTDNEGCEASREFSVLDPEPLQLQLGYEDIQCGEDSLGSITIQASGGTPDYTYFSNGNGVGPEIHGLEEGSYLLTVVDASGCEVTDSVLIEQGVPPLTGEIVGDTKVEPSGTHTYTATGDTEVLYHWNVVGGAILSGQGTHEISVEWGGAGDGQVETVAESGSACLGDTASVMVSIEEATGLEFHGSTSPVFYPNPAGEVLYVAADDVQRVTIYDLQGSRRVSTMEREVDLSGLNPGTYILAIERRGVPQRHLFIRH